MYPKCSKLVFAPRHLEIAFGRECRKWKHQILLKQPLQIMQHRTTFFADAWNKTSLTYNPISTIRSISGCNCLLRSMKIEEKTACNSCKEKENGSDERTKQRLAAYWQSPTVVGTYGSDETLQMLNLYTLNRNNIFIIKWIIFIFYSWTSIFPILLLIIDSSSD